MALLKRTAESLPAAWYYDPAQYARELEAVWYRDWVCVGRAEELREAGDYFLARVGDERIFVTLDRGGALRAFHDTCRHRGSALCTAPRGRFAGGRITCPYHGWSYALSGELVATPKMELPADFRREDYALYAVAIEAWGGFLFVNLGYNFRATEVQGAFGIHQVPKLEAFIRQRRENVEDLNAALRKYSEWLQECPGRDTDGSRSVWFGYPITVRSGAPFTRDDLVRFFESRGIETRPIMAGNFEDQPALQLFQHRIAGPLTNAGIIMRQSFFIGNHRAMGEGERRYVKECVDEFMSRWN